MKDLACLVADKSIEATLRGLLQRPQAVGIRAVEYDIFVHPRRDPGCASSAHDFLLPFRGRYHHGLVVFDQAWDGAPRVGATELENNVRTGLARLGLAQWADVVVIEPELEVWVWSDSPHVDEVLGWKGSEPSLREWLKQERLWAEGTAKPRDPKQAVERALHVAKLPRSSSRYAQLARTVSVERCADPSFGRLRRLLQGWFGERAVAHA